MHLARDMPSRLSDDNAPISDLDPTVWLAPAAQPIPSHGKVNGHVLQTSQSNSTSNDSYDEGSIDSTQTSDLSEPQPAAKGHNARPPSMNPLPNGNRGAAGDVLARIDSPTKPSMPNGLSSVTLPDRSAPQKPSTQTSAKHVEPTTPTSTSTAAFKDAHARISLSSGAGGSVEQLPVEMYMQPVNKSDIRTIDRSTPPLATNLASAQQPGHITQSPQHIASGLDPPPRNQPSPHRFSSPPVYHPASAVSSSPSPLHPPGAALKQRHTLEVPKVSSSRGSRDGVDAAFASGRFSPTTAAPTGRRASLSLMRRNTRSVHSELMPDEDALRWAEAYRQKRASKRKRIEREDDDRVLVGTKVDETHANWVTAYNMLTGIRVSVSRTNAKLDRPLTDADFHAKQKSTFDIAGNEMVPSAKYDFKFKDYAPWVFRHLRALFRLDPADYLMSLTGKYILSELGSPGKSGSFFYFSRDYKYIIKTIHHSEHKFMRKILKEYYEHVTNNPNTLLSQFYGLHRVKIPYGRKIHFVVMNNLFPPHRDIHQTFDLKGSTIGRDYKEDDLEKNPRATLKDLNWLRRKEHLEFGLEKKRLFLDQLTNDVQLLQRLKIMDYSLLIGIHDLQRGNEENLRHKTLQVFNPGGDASKEFDPHSVLMRTPSKLENQRKARELRQMINAERPVPMGQIMSGMPDELGEGHRLGFVFNQDDGGFGATHEDNSPADEIYYLGVIDCLTHYGIIKKIEHFWKGMSNDPMQISALPPEQYGERFINFISGVTMSPEEATREAQEKDQAAAESAAAADSRERVGSWSSNDGRRGKSSGPSTSQYQSLPPSLLHSMLPSGHKSPEAEATIQRAEHEAQMHHKGPRERDVPERVLKTVSSAAEAFAEAGKGGQGTSTNGAVPPPHTMERRESAIGANQGGAILPVVEEAAEGVSTTGYSRDSHISSTWTADSDGRPLTPAKDGHEHDAGFGNPGLIRNSSKARGVPPTPPKSGYGPGGAYLKPESADSGYGVAGSPGTNALRSATGSQKSQRVRSSISRESLNKELPPLPAGNATSKGVP